MHQEAIVKTVLLADEAATRDFARRLAAVPVLRNGFLALRGDLGAGKTTLVRHLLQALGVRGRIKSPTYAVVEPYTLPATTSVDAPGAAWHFDFYRFDDPREWEDAGLRDLFASPGLKLAEWPDKAGAFLPVPDLELTLALAEDAPQARTVRLVARTQTGVALLHAVAAA